MASKIEHSLNDKVRALEELQQRAERFQSFARNFNKEMVSSGQQFMGFYQEFMRVSGQMPSAQGASAPQSQTPRPPIGLVNDIGQPFQPRDLDQTSARETARSKSQAEMILASQNQVRKNAARHGVPPHPESIYYSKKEISDAGTEYLREKLTHSQSAGNIPESPSRVAQPSREETFANIFGSGKVRYSGSLLEERQAKQEERQTKQEEIEPLSRVAQLTSKDRQRASMLSATGKGSHFQYDVTDIPLAQQVGRGFQQDRAGMGKMIESLRKRDDDGTGKTIATALENVVKQMETSNTRFVEAVQTFNKVASDPTVEKGSTQHINALNELRQSIEDLNETNEGLTRTQRAARMAGEPPTPPPPPGRVREFLKNWGAPIAAGFAATTAIGAAYLQTGATMDRAIVGDERMAIMASGSFQKTLTQRQMQSADMTQAENLIKYRANILFGKEYDFIGTNPKRLMEVAGGEVRDDLIASKSELGVSRWGAAAQVAAGAGITAAAAFGTLYTAGLAAKFTIPAMMGGAAVMTSGFQSFMGAEATNPYTQMTGGAEDTWMGSWRRGPEEAQNRARLKRSRALNERQVQIMQNVEDLQNAEIQKKHARDLQPLQEQQKMLDAQSQGAVLVGGYAVSMKDMQNTLYGKPRSKSEIKTERAKQLASGEDFSPAALAGLDFLADERRHIINLPKRQEQAGQKAQEFSLLNMMGMVNYDFSHLAAPKTFSSIPLVLAPDVREQALKRSIPLVLAPDVLEQKLEEMGLERQRNLRRGSKRSGLGQRVDSVASELEMSPSELMTNMNMLTNVLGGDKEASADETARMIRIGRSGLGDYQSLMGNVANLNRTVGGHDNMQRLEQVLGSAVQAGFDKSRTAQMFLQTTTQIAQAASITNIETLGAEVRTAATLMAPLGRADERSLAMAGKGMLDYHQFTSQSGGLVGGLKTAQFFGAGGTVAGGFGIAANVGSMQAKAMIADLDRMESERSNLVGPQAEDYGKTRDPLLQAFLSTNQGDISATRKQLGAVRSGANMVFKSMVSAFGGQSVDSLVAAVKEAKTPEEREAAVQRGLAITGNIGSLTTGVGFEGGQAAFVDELDESGGISREEAETQRSAALNRSISDGLKKYRQPAKVQMRRFLDGLMVDLRDNTKGIKPEKYLGLLDAGAAPILDAKGEEITRERYESASAGEKDEMKEAINKADRSDLARSVSVIEAEMEGNVQAVRLIPTTISDLGREIVKQTREQPSGSSAGENLNK